jgi:hypothetical protein
LPGPESDVGVAEHRYAFSPPVLRGSLLEGRFLPESNRAPNTGSFAITVPNRQ